MKWLRNILNRNKSHNSETNTSNQNKSVPSYGTSNQKSSLSGKVLRKEFGFGDSGDLIRRKLIDKGQEKETHSNTPMTPILQDTKQFKKNKRRKSKVNPQSDEECKSHLSAMQSGMADEIEEKFKSLRMEINTITKELSCLIESEHSAAG